MKCHPPYVTVLKIGIPLITNFHKLLDIPSETSAGEMRAAYKAGFKDGVTLMREVQE